VVRAVGLPQQQINIWFILSFLLDLIQIPEGYNFHFIASVLFHIASINNITTLGLGYFVPEQDSLEVFVCDCFS